jgi:transcriptional regulator with XRE-family HTH domain
MTAAETLGQIQDLAQRLRRENTPIHQIAAILIERFDLTALAAYRHAHGMSQSQAADAFNTRFPDPVEKTAKNISYWEKWGGPGKSRSASARPPSLVDLQRLAELYGCLIDDLLAGPRKHPTGSAIPVPYPVLTDLLSALSTSPTGSYPENVDADHVVTFRAGIGEGTLTLELTRRDFAALIATGGLAALLPTSLALPAAAETGPAGRFRAMLAAHQAGHHLMAPAQHITALLEILRDVDSIIDTAAPAMQTELRLVKAEFAEHISWLHRERGDLTRCRRWSERATSWAIAGGDTTMAAYMVLRNASLALDAGDHQGADNLAQRARTLWEIPPALEAVAHLYQARSSAATGVIDSARLDAADELLARPSSPDQPAYLRFYGPGWAELQRATCYMTAGRPANAITILNAALTRLPTTHHRDRALHLTRIGTAHAAARCPDSAAIAGVAALAEAHRAGSQHVVAELRPLHALLTQRWPEQPKVREFAEAFTAA